MKSRVGSPKPPIPDAMTQERIYRREEHDRGARRKARRMDECGESILVSLFIGRKEKAPLLPRRTVSSSSVRDRVFFPCRCRIDARKATARTNSYGKGGTLSHPRLGSRPGGARVPHPVRAEVRGRGAVHPIPHRQRMRSARARCVRITRHPHR